VYTNGDHHVVHADRSEPVDTGVRAKPADLSLLHDDDRTSRERRDRREVHEYVEFGAVFEWDGQFASPMVEEGPRFAAYGVGDGVGEQGFAVYVHGIGFGDEHDGLQAHGGLHGNVVLLRRSELQGDVPLHIDWATLAIPDGIGADLVPHDVDHTGDSEVGRRGYVDEPVLHYVAGDSEGFWDGHRHALGNGCQKDILLAANASHFGLDHLV